MMRKILRSAFFLSAGLACVSGDAPADRDTAQAAEPPPARPVILFLGTSLTAGLGVEPAEAYPALVQAKIDSAGLGYEVVNAGESGATSAGGVRRVDWFLQLPVAALVLELGANDGLRGQDVAALRRNLQEIIDRSRAVHPNVKIVIAGMEAPPNLGSRYTAEFRRVFVDVSRDNDATLIPFLLDGVGGRAEMNQADGIHPNARGHAVMAETVWRMLSQGL